MASTGRSVAFITMGCAKNEVDTDHMRLACKAAGYAIEPDPEQADAVVVNTCSFIQAATEESIDAILEAAGYDSIASGAAHLIVSGCMPARYGNELADELPEVSSFVPCADESSIVAVLDGLFGFERMDYSPVVVSTVRDGDAPLSAYVKISDGCDRYCSYCTIPSIRGRYHSYPYAEIESEVASLVGNGTREIVLIAQDTGRWGADFDEPETLASLIARLCESFEDTWFRVMYIQPEGVTDELVAAVRDHDNACNYFDIPFQHCNGDILSSMNRRGCGQDYLDLAQRLRQAIPDVTLRTTLIAGYPGETDDQFDELCAFVEELDFDYVGVFPYSREEGTRAYSLDNQVDEDEKLFRAQRVRDIADAVSTARVADRVGSRQKVLVCGFEEDGQLFGRAACQAPDVDGVTYVDSGEVGAIIDVVIEDSLMYEMEGRRI